MEISRATCVLLFTAMGYTEASGWGKREMKSRLSKLNEIVPEDYIIGESNIDTILDEIIACNNEDESIELAKEDGPEINLISRAARAALANKTEQELNGLQEFIERDTELAAVEAITVDVADVGEELAQKPAKIIHVEENRERETQVKSKVKAEKEKKAAYRSMLTDALFTPDVPVIDPNTTFEGVRYTEGRPFYAGVVLAKYGNQHGITEDMIGELDQYMPGNPRECQSMLRMAWHVINGYVKTKLDGFKDYQEG